MLVEIANCAAADGHQVSVCLTCQDQSMASGLLPGIQVWVLGRRHRRDWDAMRRLAALIREQRVDVLHVHGRSTLAFVLLAQLSGRMQCPVVLHHHSSKDIGTAAPVSFRWVIKHFISRYVGVCAQLGQWGEAAGIPRSKISVIDNAIDIRRIQQAIPSGVRRDYGIRADCLVGIVVGGLRRVKGIDLLLEAFARSSYRRSAKILIVGGERETEYARACRDRSISLGLGDSIIFLGDRQDVPALLREVDFAVHPARSESGPLALIEYMAGGLPFVSTRAGSVAHRAAELGVPEFVPPGDVAALTEALERLLRLSPAERRRRGQLGLDVARRHFDIRSAMSRWHEVYRAAQQNGKQ